MNKPPTELSSTSQENKPPVGVIIISFSILLIFLGFVGWGLFRSQQGPIVVGQPAPDFLLTSFSGEIFSKDALEGKIVVLNFWASWCSPCKNEAPFLEKAWQQFYASDDIIILGIDYVDTETEALDFIAKLGISYPNGADRGTSISEAYRISGVPETFIIDQSGNIAYIQIGPFTQADELINIIHQLREPSS